MAFERSKNLHKCRECGAQSPYFKLIESRREDTRDPDGPHSEYPRYWRLCIECESKKRTAEFALWTEEAINEDPLYPRPEEGPQ